MEPARQEPIRNVAIVSGAGAGKTSLSEALLYVAGAVPILGSVAQGTTVSDFEPEELRHRNSTSTSLLQFSWNHTNINLIDPPGALDLLGEPLVALQAVDAVILVLNGNVGVRTELTRLWARIKELDLPCLIFVNGLDKEGASFETALEICRKQFDCVPIPMTIPVNSGTVLHGVVDVWHEIFVRSGPNSNAVERVSITRDLEGTLGTARKQLVEAIAESGDTLLETYVTQGYLDQEDLLQGLRRDIRTRQFLPVYAGSATQNVGVWSLLDAIVTFLPSPSERAGAHPWLGIHPETHEGCERKGSLQEPFSAYVFKTIIDPFVGRLSYCRVVSGTIHADAMVFNASKHVREKLGHFYTVLGKRHVAVASAQGGEIVAIGKLKDTHTGDSLCQENTPILLSRVEPSKADLVVRD